MQWTSILVVPVGATFGASRASVDTKGGGCMPLCTEEALRQHVFALALDNPQVLVACVLNMAGFVAEVAYHPFPQGAAASCMLTTACSAWTVVVCLAIHLRAPALVSPCSHIVAV